MYSTLRDANRIRENSRYPLRRAMPTQFLQGADPSTQRAVEGEMNPRDQEVHTYPHPHTHIQHTHLFL